MSTPSSAAAIGARLRRLSERIDQDCARLYAAQGLHFEQRWFGVMNQLIRAEGLSVKELAALLGISHASVSETRKSLLAAGLIESAADPYDARSVRLSLSREGRAMFAQFAPLWQTLDAVSTELSTEAGELVRALDMLDGALDRESLFDRVTRRLPAAPA